MEGVAVGGSGGAAVSDRASEVRDDSPDVVRSREERKFQYPGIPTTCDGSETVVHVEINAAHTFSEGQNRYPNVIETGIHVPDPRNKVAVDNSAAASEP